MYGQKCDKNDNFEDFCKQKNIFECFSQFENVLFIA